MKDHSPEPPSVPGAPDLWTTVERHVIAAGVPPREVIAGLHADLRRSPDPERALRNFVRFLESGFSTSLLREFHQYPVLQQTLLTLLSQSQYLSDILVRDPELFRWLTGSDALRRIMPREELLDECRRAARLFQRIEKKVDAVKRIHRREYLRIGSREILRESTIRTSTAELSVLADVVLEVMLEIAHDDLCQRTGATFESTLAAIGLGKLGGQELNFSSDIDLMFIYERDEHLPGLGERVQSAFDFYRRVAEFVVRALSDITSEGRLYRVDLRLRPDGASGPLVMSVGASLVYYETRGEPWERQMLLKARPAAGSLHTARMWLEGIFPFVFPKTQLRSPLVEIAGIKRQIEAHLGKEENVKLGSGGIRDIEFAVQALQLLYGGAQERLRTRATLDVLDVLESLQLLNTVEAASLREAYEFFRIVEHRLQLLHGFQTHALPVREEEYTQLARRLGFDSSEDLRLRIAGHRRHVRLIYDSIFHPVEGGGVPREGANELKELLAGVPEQDRADVEKLFERLGDELNLGQGEEAIKGIARAMIEHGAVLWTLRNLLQLAGAAGIRKGLQQSLEKPELATLFVLLAARSSNLISLLASEPLLFETLVSQPEEFFSDRPAFGFLAQTDHRRYYRFNEFKASLQLFLGASSFEAYARSLSDLADHVLVEVLGQAAEEVGRTTALPPLSVVALGKFGGRELTIGSDLDCVIVYEEDSSGDGSSMAVEQVAQKLLGRLRTMGLPEVDFRLRPEGRNAPLGAEFRYLKEYFSGRASLWEVQSLVKARLVGGEKALGRRVLEFLRSRISEFAAPRGWVDDILGMRQRMMTERAAKAQNHDLKLGEGGLVDLEFAVQMLQLRYGADDEDFLVPNSFDAVRNLHQRGYLDSQEWKTITRNTVLLRILETLIRLNGPQGGSTMPTEGPLLEVLARGSGHRDVSSLQSSLLQVRQENSSLLVSIAERCRT